MAKRYIIMLFLTFISFLFFKAKAQPPSGYYDSANNLSGQALFDALNLIIRNHNQQTYDALWTHFLSTDKKSDGKVWDMYSDTPGANPPYQYIFVTNQCGNYSKEGDCYNREHSWPASWFNDSYPAYSDLFHIYPTDGYVNNRRGNYPFGEVISPTWISQNGGKLGPNVFSGYSGTVFEPINEYKGDFARSFFYMSVRYNKQDASWATTDMTIKSELKPWSIQLLYSWHINDTVSQKEIDRNNAVYNIQGNRNPFIDNPFWVRSIWGPDAGITSNEIPEEVLIFPNPADGILHIAFNGHLSANYIITFNSVDGRFVTLYPIIKDDYLVFNTEQLPSGFYILTIRFKGNSNIIHKKLSLVKK